MSVPIPFGKPRGSLSLPKPQESLPALQSKVLRHICSTTNASYETLANETKRHRITILHSLKSLLRDGYIEEQKINPKYPKSKLVFLPTVRGISFAWVNLRLKIDDMALPSDDKIANYIQYVKEVFTNPQQQQMLGRLFNEFRYRNLETRNGDSSTKKEIIQDCFCRGLLELVRQNDYSAKTLGSKASMKWLNRIFSPEELGEIKKLLTLIRDNLTVTIQYFPA